MRARMFVALMLLISALMSALSAPAALAAPAFQSAPDPGTVGPRATTRTSYDGGDQYYFPAGWSRAVEMRARVTYPTNLSSGGPFPLIMLMHGKHNTCYSAGGSHNLAWPCASGFQPLPSHLGYDYLGDVLASHGFIVVSISANGINAWDDNQSSDRGMTARGDLFLRHLQFWQTFNTVTNGTFGNLFVGRVSLNNVGLMGHSRGGEGAVRAFQMNAAAGSPFGIRAVFPLAPVDFGRPVINNVPLAVLLPYCDGDVRDLQGVHYYDDARYNVAGDTAAKYTILVMGANHNFYNTNWTPGAIPGGFDDWLDAEDQLPGGVDSACNPTTPGNQRLSATQQRATGIAYMSAFFRVYLRGETAFAPILQGDAPPPSSAQTSAIKMSYHAPGTAAARRDINRYLTAANLTTNTLGGAVTTTSLAQHAVCGGDAPMPQFCLSSSTTTSFAREPHSGVSQFATSKRGPGQLNLQWATTAAIYRNALPAGSRDVSSFTRLQFRVSTVWGNSANPPGTAKNFRVLLTDGASRTAVANMGDHTNALDYPLGNLSPVTPKVVLNMARIPTHAFTGVDLKDIRTVEFRLDQQATGWLLVTDLAFANAVPTAPPTVSGASPSAAFRGQSVSINGTNLAGATSVRFNGTTATNFSVTNATQISAAVPDGATSGPISVTTPGGTATSSSSFTVHLTAGSIGVQVGDQPGPALSATFSARPACGPIQSIQFGNPGASFSNANVTVTGPGGGPADQRTGFTYTPPPSTTVVSLTITRVQQTGGATVNPVRISDGCGVWNTFVGGGPSAFN